MTKDSLVTTDQSTIPFGASVAIEGRLERVSEWDGKRLMKLWKRRMLLSTAEGILIGYRTLSNGVREYLGEGDGCAFIPKEYFRAALVVTGPKSKPFFVRLDDVKEWSRG
jgi:hypothetical protein